MPVMERWAFAPQTERWIFNGLHGLVAGTGVAYFCMKYLMTSDDPFALVNHPWQGAMVAAHMMAGPALIVFFGMAFRSHALWKIIWPSPVARRTGWASTIGFPAMAVSGYLIQVASSPALVTVFIWTHGIAAVLFTAAYCGHLVIGYRTTRRMRDAHGDPRGRGAPRQRRQRACSGGIPASARRAGNGRPARTGTPRAARCSGRGWALGGRVAHFGIGKRMAGPRRHAPGSSPQRPPATTRVRTGQRANTRKTAGNRVLKARLARACTPAVPESAAGARNTNRRTVPLRVVHAPVGTHHVQRGRENIGGQRVFMPDRHRLGAMDGQAGARIEDVRHRPALDHPRPLGGTAGGERPRREVEGQRGPDAAGRDGRRPRASRSERGSSAHRDLAPEVHHPRMAAGRGGDEPPQGLALAERAGV